MELSRRKKIAARLDPIRLGAHMSIAGGLCKSVHRANALGCTALQIFTKNASTWRERKLSVIDIENFTEAAESVGLVHVAAHTSYLINLASPDRKNRLKSVRALIEEIRRATQLGIPMVVMHPGAHKGHGESEGIRRLTEGINRVFDAIPEATTHLLLETTAGQGTCLGHRFGQIAEVIHGIDRQEIIGTCLDTAHIFAAGYDIRTPSAFNQTLAEFDAVVGLDRLRLLHLNDSKKMLGSRVDRHEHIGQGTIGIESFKLVMNDPRFKFVPKIIETPKKGKEGRSDQKNLKRLRALAA